MSLWKRSAERRSRTTPLSFDEVYRGIRGFVEERSPSARGAGVTVDTRLFSSGYLDSLAFAALVVFAEREFHVELGRRDVTMDSLDRVGDAVFLVVGLSAGSG